MALSKRRVIVLHSFYTQGSWELITIAKYTPNDLQIIINLPVIFGNITLESGKPSQSSDHLL